MQVIANLSSNAIVQTEAEQLPGSAAVRNGHYVIQLPEGTAVEVVPTSHIIPQDATSIPTLAAGELLIRFPMFDHVIYNYLLEDTDIAALDFSSSAPQPASGTVTPGSPSWAGVYSASSYPRCQVGRGGGGALGVAPNSVAVLTVNSTRASPSFGSLVTALQDITAFNPGTPGTDDVMMWWEIAQVVNTEDTLSGFNATLGVNTPNLRSLQKTAPEPADFFVYVSVDDGVSWTQANYLEPADLVTPGINLRIAFLNTGTLKYYVLGYAILFQDLP